MSKIVDSSGLDWHGRHREVISYALREGWVDRIARELSGYTEEETRDGGDLEFHTLLCYLAAKDYLCAEETVEGIVCEERET